MIGENPAVTSNMIVSMGSPLLISGLDHQKCAFLERYNPHRSRTEALAMAIGAAVKRNPTYSNDLNLYDKSSLLREWRRFLSEKISDYTIPRTDGQYEKDIEALQTIMNARFRKAFCHPTYTAGPGFRIAHAQKSLSVFLKHLWCMGDIVTPPQCPVDSRILKLAGQKYPETNWGYVNSIDEHRKKIGFLQIAVPSGQSLPEWELMQFQV